MSKKIKGRILSENFKNESFIKEVANKVRESQNNFEDYIFLGVRNNQLNLYVAGGSVLKIENKNPRKIKCTLDYGYLKNKTTNEYYFKMDDKLRKIEENIQSSTNDVTLWLNQINDIKELVKNYQYAENTCRKYSIHTKKEKIIQQKICYAFNTQKDSKYYAYDMEYNIEGMKKNVKDAQGNNLMNDKKLKQITPGRADIMLIGKQKNNKFNIVLMEIKESTNSFGGVSQKNHTLGSGIVGHLNNYLPLIKALNTTGIIHNDLTNEDFNLRRHIVNEAKETMRFLQKYNLITNPNFQNINYDSLTEENVTFDFALYLSDCDEKEISFKNHLGISPKGNAKYNVKNLLKDKKIREELNLQFINLEDVNFKYISSSKNYQEAKVEDIIIDLEKYKIINSQSFE